jgi:hypothetical protein
VGRLHGRFDAGRGATLRCNRGAAQASQQRPEVRMPTSIAVFSLALLGCYASIGVAFAIAFQLRGLARIDAAAARSSRGFRIAITPGVVALWPMLSLRWLRATRGQS